MLSVSSSKFEPYPYRRLRLHVLYQRLLAVSIIIYHDQIDIMEQAATNILMRIFI